MAYCRAEGPYTAYAYRDVFGGWTCCGPQLRTLPEFAAHMADHVARGEAHPRVMQRINRELQEAARAAARVAE